MKIKFTEEEIKQYQKNTNNWANPNLIFFEGCSNQNKEILKLKKRLQKEIKKREKVLALAETLSDDVQEIKPIKMKGR